MGTARQLDGRVSTPFIRAPAFGFGFRHGVGSRHCRMFFQTSGPGRQLPVALQHTTGRVGVSRCRPIKIAPWVRRGACPADENLNNHSNGHAVANGLKSNVSQHFSLSAVWVILLRYVYISSMRSCWFAKILDYLMFWRFLPNDR